jgi:hypothetical protein
MIYVLQQVKNNKEDSLGLAEHARDVTYKLFDALQSLDNLDSMRMNIESYIQYVTQYTTYRDGIMYILTGLFVT